jgi:hypothetical protein
MTESILYNFGSNNSSLDDINSSISGIQQAKDDIANVFSLLATVYEGDGATALNQAQTQVNAMLDDAMNNSATTQQNAQDQQDAMQALDRANAAAF